MHLESLENLKKYTDVVLATIAEAYETDKITNPRDNHMIMSMFALLCEKKVEGFVPEDAPISPKWRLVDTDDEFENL